jgi:hypothetical protein
MNAINYPGPARYKGFNFPGGYSHLNLESVNNKGIKLTYESISVSYDTKFGLTTDGLDL